MYRSNQQMHTRVAIFHTRDPKLPHFARERNCAHPLLHHTHPFQFSHNIQIPLYFLLLKHYTCRCYTWRSTIYTEIFANFANFTNACCWWNFFPQLIFLYSENFDTLNFACVIVSARAYAHTSNSRAPPTTSWKVTRAIDKVKIWRNFCPNTKYEPLAKILSYTV